MGVGHFLNFFRFLSTGKKPSLVDWILRLDHISMHGNRRRDVGYTNMTRELIWGGFMVIEKKAPFKNVIIYDSLAGVIGVYFAANQLPFGQEKAAEHSKLFQAV